jgi:RNA polymerase sigma-70 factor, ECF subfamily
LVRHPVQEAHISIELHAGVLVQTDKWVSPTGPMKYVPGFEDTLTDEALLKFCAEGESAALRELVRRYQAPLYRFLARLMGSDEDAEDAALEVFVRAWKNAPRFQYRAKVATWLYRIAVNIARDAHSRKKVRPKEVWLEDAEVKHLGVESAEDDALRRVGREYQSTQLRRALERLSPDDRLILVLYYLEDREYEEIQSVTGLSYTVLKTRLARARRRLRKWMEAEIAEAEK